MNKLLLSAWIFLVLFSSCTRNTVTDADGNIYHTVKIGKQVWMVENFRATKWNDGTPIPHVSDSVAWHSLTTPGYCYYGNTNNADTIKRFGALYNWYCVDSKKFAPPGWHVPTDDDWDTLQNYLIRHGYNWDGERRDNRVAKSLAAQSGWKPFGIEGMPGNNMKDNNRSGFSGFAAGYRHDSRDTANWHRISVFWAAGHKAAWWSATEVTESIACVYGLGFCADYLIKYGHDWLKTCGYPVRLVRDRK
ncbi:MAG TPA: fibrobacter succinogenes major paralogous domain-containing protein [Chitinivibrionales bacterium]|nr:fibrobacter succinogenes major paralogous domain-containing protein [Chitinivibrionales bacterium]